MNAYSSKKNSTSEESHVMHRECIYGSSDGFKLFIRIPLWDILKLQNFVDLFRDSHWKSCISRRRITQTSCMMWHLLKYSPNVCNEILIILLNIRLSKYEHTFAHANESFGTNWFCSTVKAYRHSKNLMSSKWLSWKF